jgi:hypothetical protein
MFSVSCWNASYSDLVSLVGMLNNDPNKAREALLRATKPFMVSDELVTQAVTQLDALKKHDSTFLRAYVLTARVQMVKKDFEAAVTDLDTVLTMRKEHDVAQELREWIKKHPKGDEKPVQ